MTEIDTYTGLDEEQSIKLHLKRALYRIKAALVSIYAPICLLIYHINNHALLCTYSICVVVERKAG